RAGDREAHRREGLTRLLTELLREGAQRVLDPRGLPRVDLLERNVGGATDRGIGPVGVHRLEEEARARRILRELLDLLLHERRRRAHALLRPVVSLLAQVA